MWEKSCQIVLSSRKRRSESSACGVSRSSTATAPCASNCAVSAARSGRSLTAPPAISGAARRWIGRVVVLAQRLDLRIGQRRHIVRELVRNRAVTARQQLEAQALPRLLRQMEKLLGIVFELVARRGGQRLQRDGGAVVAAPQLVGARQMIERAPALALRQPQEAQGAMRLVMLRLERRGAAERLDRLRRVAERVERDRPVVVRRDEAGVGS